VVLPFRCIAISQLNKPHRTFKPAWAGKYINPRNFPVLEPAQQLLLRCQAHSLGCANGHRAMQGCGLAEGSLKTQRLRWRDRLSVKQARAAVIITLLIGLVFSIAQIAWDLHEERNLIDRTVNQVLSTLRES